MSQENTYVHLLHLLKTIENIEANHNTHTTSADFTRENKNIKGK
jgi:hypothetical protein